MEYKVSNSEEQLDNEKMCNTIDNSTSSNNGHSTFLSNLMYPPKKKESIVPGDVIQYYSTAYVFGNKQGEREAIVLEVTNNNDYPLTLDNYDRLPNDTWIKCIKKLKRNSNHKYYYVEIKDSVWNKIHNFTLNCNNGSHLPFVVVNNNKQLSIHICRSWNQKVKLLVFYHQK